MNQFDYLKIPTGPPADPPDEGGSAPSNARAHSPAYSYNSHGGQIQTQGVVRATARMERTVDVGGIQTSPEVAERMGLTPTEQPRDELAEAKAEAEAPKVETPSETPEGPALGAEFAESREVLVKAVPAPTLEALVHAVTSESTINIERQSATAAEAMGVPREQFDATLRHTIAGLQQQANAAIQGKGVEPLEFYEWARANHPREIGAAMRLHFSTLNAGAYAGLVEKFIRSPASEPDEATLTANGIETWVERPSRTRMVRIGGLPVPLKVAMRNGWIRPA